MGTKHQKMKPFSDTNSSNRRENISTPIANRIAEIRYQLITTFYQMQTIKNIRNQSTTEDSKMYFDIKMFELENAIMILQKRHEKFQSNVASLVDYVKNCTTKTNSHFEKNELLTDDKSPIKEYLRKESPNFSSLPVSCEYETTKNYDNKNNFKLQSKLGEDVKTFGDHFFNKEIFEAKKQTYPYHFSTPTVMMLNISKQGKGSSFLKSKLKEKATDYRKTKDDSKKATKNDKKKPSSNEGDKSKNKTKETSKFTEKEVKNPLDAELSISEIKQILIEEGFEEQITRAYETTGKQMEILDASEQKTEEHSQENGEKTQITDKLSICTPVFQTKVNKQENEPHNTDNQHQSEIPAVVNKPDIKKANATNDRNLLITNLLNEEKSDEKIEIVKPQIIRTRSSWFFSVESGTSVKSKWSNLTQNKCVHKLQIKDNTSVLSLDKTITQKLNTVSSVSNEKIENTLETKRSHTSRSRSLSKISMYSASANVKKANTISNKTVQEDLCKPKIVTCPNLKRPPNFFTKKRSQSEKSRPVNTNNKPVKTRESDGKRSNTVNITEYRQNKSSALKASHTAAKLAQADKRRAREMAVESDDGTIASGLEYSNKSKNITQKDVALSFPKS
ncbi:uncharacterized protein LOC108735475 [Agrilus planipennis]|uniref:Uncharacterized protein LOC108735475 n=1 Tax=Agrilus planipennis TaxID=224129 RepID=A0A1W4WG92_AGRPL|nr:uncharacterized protein LOC108735475 [Agrilus planipennis]